jgi:branched-chain amino acid transport system substrate-binding protein
MAAVMSGAHAQGSDAMQTVPISLVVPLSGQYARGGQLEKFGAEMAVDEINRSGGIAALKGAKLVLKIHDAGESVESAVQAATRSIDSDKPVAGMGAWVSSFTLGVTEVSERRRVPWLSLSFADTITNRGFQYVYQTSPVSSVFAIEGFAGFRAMMDAAGRKTETVGLLGDTTAAVKPFMDVVRNSITPKLGMKVVVDETWSSPLADAATLSQKVAAKSPDFIFIGTASFSDAQQILQSNRGFGVKSANLAGGGYAVMPEFVKAVGAKTVEGLMSIVPAHPLAASKDLEKRFVARTGEPFMVIDSLAGYYNTWIIKAAIEAAGKADPEAVNAALKKIELVDGPAVEALGVKSISFDEKGRRRNALPVIVQWQDGLPVVVYPPSVAAAKAR